MKQNYSLSAHQELDTYIKVNVEVTIYGLNGSIPPIYY